ncbi:MAG TPA: succinate dehydrogenase, hydrophobic membrane anchor protein [Usitatibacter sp.]|nr:succinate dehydrogenase, hydrophobic membrane anchor protein [Usitatibacter sp.]
MVKAYTKTPVGAHYGLGDWLLQRLTAVVMALYTMIALGVALACPPASYDDLKTFFSGGFFRLVTMLFFASLLYHAWIGMRDILMDYVRATGLRLALQAAVALALLFYLLWSAAVLWGR